MGLLWTLFFVLMFGVPAVYCLFFLITGMEMPSTKRDYDEEDKKRKQLMEEQAERSKKDTEKLKSSNINYSACMTCSKRGACSGKSCSGYSSDPNIKKN